MEPKANAAQYEFRMARAIYEALKADAPRSFMGPMELGTRVSVDGRFDLLSVARTVITAMALDSRS